MNSTDTIYRQRRTRLAAAVFDSLSEGVTIADATLPDMPLIYVNRAFERLTGYSADEALGRNCRFLHLEERDQDGLEVLRTAIRAGESCTVVIRNYRKDGTLFHNELHISPILGEDGSVEYFIGIQRDVTDRVNADASLWKLNDDLIRANKELQGANDRLSELVYVTAHDVKSPLTSILLTLELLEEKIGTMSRATLRKRIRHLRGVAKHMRDIIIEVLETRRMETDEAAIELEPIDLRLKAELVMRFHRDAARAKRIKLVLEGPQRLPKAFADRGCTLSVLDNLLSNAVKYSPVGGTVTVRVGATGTTVRTEVEDQGPGIGDEDRGKLFGRFARLSAQPTAGEHSTGLGLYIAKKYVDLMKGRLSQENIKGGGSRFVVDLPRHKRTHRGKRGTEET